MRIRKLDKKNKKIFGIRRVTLYDCLYLTFITAIAVGVIKTIVVAGAPDVIPSAKAEIISPPPLNNGLTPIPTQTPVPTEYPKPVVDTDQKKEIVMYIQEVFGDDADKAFYLLTCENSALNPDAVNTAGNYPVGSRDIGVFQINEYWQGVNGRFLFNWKINVLAAHQIFQEDGNSFKLWTCGRKLGL